MLFIKKQVIHSASVVRLIETVKPLFATYSFPPAICCEPIIPVFYHPPVVLYLFGLTGFRIVFVDFQFINIPVTSHQLQYAFKNNTL